jgi:hypothetical protein
VRRDAGIAYPDAERRAASRLRLSPCDEWQRERASWCKPAVRMMIRFSEVGRLNFLASGIDAVVRRLVIDGF